MSLKPFLQLDGISLRAGNRLVFRNTHWIFDRDQNWALIGPNGSGKTLLGCVIAGELPVAKGEIRYGFRAPALVKSPDLLLLDEPCQGLDLAHRNMFLKSVESLLNSAQTTIVYVTHVSEEIPGGIRRILHLKNGRVSGSTFR
jgi:ABC-type molybdenum transport system ATPase subunit/photorepair protein PhrA